MEKNKLSLNNKISRILMNIINDLDSILAQSTAIQDINLKKELGDIDYYGGYRIPNCHIRQLQQLLDSERESISKMEVINLFLSLHGATIDSLRQKDSKKARYEGIKSLVDSSNYEMVDSGNPENPTYLSPHFCKIKKEIEDGMIYIFYHGNVKTGWIPEILSISIWFPWEARLLLDSENFIDFSKGKRLSLSSEVLGKRVHWSQEIDRNSKDISRLFKQKFQKDPDLKKLNFREVMKDAEFQIKGMNGEDSIEFSQRYYDHDSAFTWKFHKAYLGCGNFFLKWLDDHISQENGTLAEFTIENITQKSWDELKATIISVSEYLFGAKPS